MPEEKNDAATVVAERIAGQDTQKTAGIKDVPANEEEITAEGDAEVAEVLEGEAETSEAEEESSTPLKTDATAEEAEDEVSELLKKPEPKDNVQKRIDQLTAEKKALQAQLDQYKTKAPETKGEPEYTDAQLKKALNDAMEKGDSDLIFEIMDYKAKKVERDLRKAYLDDVNSRQAAEQKIYTEWNDVVTDYSRVWEDEAGKEIYPGAANELDIKKADSLLYRTAKALMSRVDENGRNIYFRDGGQRIAVADALALILRRKKLTGNEKKLERALSKEKRKKSLGSGSAMEVDIPAKPKSHKENLSDYMEERKAFLNKRK